MEVEPLIHFDDTAVAFSYKSDGRLKKAHLIFSLVSHPTISSLATAAVKVALAFKLPIKGLIRSTVFDHFCGGETIEKSEETIQRLAQFHVGTILDYSVEGAETEEGFDTTASEILSTLDKAKGNPAIPFCVFKLTGMAAFSLLEKVQSNQLLTDGEKAEFERVRDRVDKICSRANEFEVPILIDAEDSWIQNGIDALAYEMMGKYNKGRAIVFNTYQMYRADMLNNLKEAFHNAAMHNYYLGVKMVRGAYMEKERERAEKMEYPDPIHVSKNATDDSFNSGLTFCLDNKQRITLVCGTHNEYSNQYLALLMQKHGMKQSDKRVWFAQLLGMSDNISFNLAKDGYNVVKYVPYGPVEAVMPYLLRRAAENTSVTGQSSRELMLIRKELKRRKSNL
ncbi:MAG: proline dehydrogenase family protein [Bacteroidia bacterium]|nr:proline dehydrogenase family protein [Bacteroidia bacterium]